MIALLASASAATLIVGSSSAAQYATIQVAVASAQSGDELVVEPGSYTGGIDLNGKSVTLRSRDGAATTTIRDGAYGLIYLDQGESNVVIDGFTFRNASGVGVFVEYGSSVSIRNSTFEGCGYAGTYGGGVAIGTGTVSIEDSVFRDNTAGWGAHIFFGGGSLDVVRTSFDGGSATYGGAVYTYGGPASFTASTFTANASASGGGALYVAYGGIVALTETEVRNNFAEAYHGGAIYLEGANLLTVDGGVIAGNQITTWESGYLGGAIAAPGGATITLRNTELSENTAYYGGAIYGVGMTLTLDGATLRDNYAYYGGAIFETGTAATSTGTLWDSNTVYYNGGAVYSGGSSAWTITGDTFRENLATYGGGGAMIMSAGGLGCTDTAFEQNYAYSYGGALYLSSLGTTATFTRGSFDQNEAQYGYGGALYTEYYSSVATDGTSYTRNTAVSGGLGHLYYGSSFTGSNLVADANSADQGAGAVYVTAGGVPTTASITASQFTDNACEGDAGAIHLSAVLQATLLDNVLLRNRAGGEAFGGGVLVQDSGRTVAQRNLFAFNVARYGGGAYVQATTNSGTWTNNVFMENTAAYGGAGCVADAADESWVNNTFVGNAATEEGGGLCIVDSAVDLRDNLYAWTSDGAAVHVWTSGKVGPTFGYNAFYENTEGDGGGDAGDITAAPGTVRGAPLLVAYSHDGTEENDQLQPLRDSPLVDAGDPALLDPDGTVADIGATGGPGASAVDADLDGYPASSDCDDTNAQVNPDAFETWYDGVNADCRGWSDFDQDGDGTEAESYGGTDCDDTDPAVISGCAGDSGSPDPDRPPVDNKVGGSCGCASGGANMGGLGGLLVLALASARRRRA